MQKKIHYAKTLFFLHLFFFFSDTCRRGFLEREAITADCVSIGSGWTKGATLGPDVKGSDTRVKLPNVSYIVAEPHLMEVPTMKEYTE